MPLPYLIRKAQTFIFSFLLLLSSFSTFSQNNAYGSLKGKVIDAKDKSTLPSAEVSIHKGNFGSVTDINGQFSISKLPIGTHKMYVSFIGYETVIIEISIEKDKTQQLTIELHESLSMLDAVTIVGSRSKPRSLMDSPVPIDNIPLKQLESSGKAVLDQQLMFSVPSYNSTQQPISDASAHFSPADLRGLFPSRTLVLVNGKRKNSSALVYSYSTPGRGEVGVDMKSIPSAALQSVEILRDGASAQYGSDAVAGVINLVMSKESKPFVNLNTSITSEGDGEQAQLETGFGINLLDKGFANFTFSHFKQSRSQRAGNVSSAQEEADYWGTSVFSLTDFEEYLERNPKAGFQVGLPDLSIFNFSYNAGFTLDKETETELYSFATATNRTGSSPQFARTPYWINDFQSIYPGQDFFLPEMAPQIKDYTFSLGLKTVYNDWKLDLSSTSGLNRIDYYIINSFNESYGASSPSDFYNGAHEFSQIVNNLDLVKTFTPTFVKDITFAFGAEHRTETFITEAGDEASWADATPNLNDRFGAESFPGFKPESEATDYRNNFGLYTEATSDITDKFLIGGALRFEDYSDFGTNLSWKVNSRIKLLNNKLSVRASVSNGFRAPSLHQIYYTSLVNILSPNGIVQSGILNNENPALRALGVPLLKPETSFNVGIGFTYRIGKNIGLTVDAYQVTIDDRIGLSGQIIATGDSTSPIDQVLNNINTGSAGFFLNAINSKSQGIDIVLTLTETRLSKGSINGNISANFNKTTVESVNLPSFITENGLSDNIFSREDISRIETWRPRQKVVASMSYNLKKWSSTLSFLYYGAVTYKHPTNIEDDRIYGGKTLTDLSFVYRINPHVSLTLGVNNLFNVYPDELSVTTDRNVDFVGRFKYPWQTTQFGIDGTRFFSRISMIL